MPVIMILVFLVASVMSQTSWCRNDGWIQWSSDSMCYKYFDNDTYRFQEANRTCNSYGGYPTSLKSQAQQDFLFNDLCAGNSLTFWIGLYKVDDTFYWYEDNTPKGSFGTIPRGNSFCYVGTDTDTGDWFSKNCNSATGSYIVCVSQPHCTINSTETACILTTTTTNSPTTTAQLTTTDLGLTSRAATTTIPATTITVPPTTTVLQGTTTAPATMTTPVAMTTTATTTMLATTTIPATTITVPPTTAGPETTTIPATTTSVSPTTTAVPGTTTTNNLPTTTAHINTTPLGSTSTTAAIVTTTQETMTSVPSTITVVQGTTTASATTTTVASTTTEMLAQTTIVGTTTTVNPTMALPTSTTIPTATTSITTALSTTPATTTAAVSISNGAVTNANVVSTVTTFSSTTTLSASTVTPDGSTAIAITAHEVDILVLWIVIGVIIGLLGIIIGLSIWWCLKRKKIRRSRDIPTIENGSSKPPKRRFKHMLLPPLRLAVSAPFKAPGYSGTGTLSPNSLATTFHSSGYNSSTPNKRSITPTDVLMESVSTGSPSNRNMISTNDAVLVKVMRAKLSLMPRLRPSSTFQ